MTGRLERSSFDDVPYTCLTADDSADLPLILVLHGANSSTEVLAMMRPAVESMWADCSLVPCVLACASTPTVGGFYIGQWETFVATAFRDFVVREQGCGPVALLGSSMGGYGALKMAFASPQKWRAVAAIAPALLDADAKPRNIIGVMAELHAAMAANGFEANSVLHRLRTNASAIRDSGLPIFLRCGDRDMFHLHDGTERLHRALWDLDIGHDYHLVHGGDHVGPEAAAAQRAALAFISAALRPQTEQDGPPPPDLDPFSAAAPAAVRAMMAPELAEVARRDPTAARRYGIL